MRRLPDASNQAQWLWINLHPNRAERCPHRVKVGDKLTDKSKEAETWVISECKGFFFCDGEFFHFSDSDSALHFRMRWT